MLVSTPTSDGGTGVSSLARRLPSTTLVEPTFGTSDLGLYYSGAYYAVRDLLRLVTLHDGRVSSSGLELPPNFTVPFSMATSGVLVASDLLFRKLGSSQTESGTILPFPLAMLKLTYFADGDLATTALPSLTTSYETMSLSRSL